jgi:hypothetical protein
MLQAHSLLWHYLWVAPNLFLLLLGILIAKRGLRSQVPGFFAFCWVGALGELTLYTADLLPSVPAGTFWGIYWVNTLAQALLKFFVIGEVFAGLSNFYPSIAQLGRLLIRGLTAVIVLIATFAAAYAPRDGSFVLVSGAHFLEQTIYIVECGLLLFVVLFAAYFHLSWARLATGITLGLSISACVHMAVWALLANAGLPVWTRNILVFVKMGAYHFCVVLWFYYVLVPKNFTIRLSPPLPENTLDLWNRELERLLQ